MTDREENMAPQPEQAASAQADQPRQSEQTPSAPQTQQNQPEQGSAVPSAEAAAVKTPPASKEQDSTQQEELEQRPLGAVVTRNSYYRDGYRRLTRLAMILAFANVALIVTIIVLISSLQPQDRFFATTADGRLIRMVPLGQPNLNDSALISWASRAAADVMTFGFHDYQRRLQESSVYFTRGGWQSFSEALKSARIIETVEERQQIVTASPQRAPVILQQGMLNGVYQWVVDLPLVVTYQSGNASQSDVLNVRMIIVRVSTLDNPHGIGIQQWIAK
jgi:intracellular multiplication protein IcmL